MFYRLLAALLLLIGFAAPANAVEINTDTGCDSSGAWMVQTGWTVSGSKCVGSDVRSMKMLMQMNSAIKKDHRYRITFTVSGYSGSGAVRAFAGISMPSSPTGSWVLASSLTPIADRFTLAVGTGLISGGPNYSAGELDGPGDSAEDIGSMRIFCTHANFGMVDPILLPGYSGAGHIHEFVGNTGVNENSTYATLRTKGSTSCQDSTGTKAKYPVNPTAYWWPAVMDGLGHVIRENMSLVYYKGPSAPPPVIDYTGAIVADSQYVCNERWGGASLTVDQLGATVTDESRCPQIPHGMKYIFGYNKANGQGRPDVATDISGDNGTGAVTSGTQGAIDFSCWKGPDFISTDESAVVLSPNYQTLAAIMAAAAANPTYCPLNSVLHVGYGAPWCWDGYYIDSPDHRSHVAYGIRATAHVGNAKCPTTHPYAIPQMSIQNFYTIDQAFKDQKWRLSIDEMVDGLPAGAGAHMDYFWAWSPTASNLWFTRCYHVHNSCTNDLGNGTHIPGPKSYDGSGQFCNGCAKHRPDRYVSTTEYGMSWDYTANGTYTVDLTSLGDGVFGFFGLRGFNGSLDNISVTEIPAKAHN